MDEQQEIRRKSNPKQHANPISTLLFLYMFPIFKKNFQQQLQEDDLFDVLTEYKASTLGDRTEKNWQNKLKNHPTFPLHVTLLKMFGVEYLVYGVCQFINDSLLLALLPFAVGNFISYFENNPQLITRNEAFIYATLIMITIIIDVFLNHCIGLAILQMSMKMAIGCSSAIYRKCLKLNQATLAKISVGHIITLLSNDISNFEYGFLNIHYMWIAPIHAIIGIYLLYNAIGISAFSGVCFLLLFIPLQMYFGKKRSQFRYKTVLRTDERVNLMNEFLHGIQVIKMYTWEKPFVKLISQARSNEIKQIRRNFYLDAITFSLEVIVPGIAVVISIITFIYLNNDITASTIYTVLTIYDALRMPLLVRFADGISDLAEMNVSLRRIQSFLKNDNNVEIENYLNKNNIKSIITNKYPHILLKNITASWSGKTSEAILIDINLEITTNQLTAIIGPVGSGKSSLINVILKELPVTNGYIVVNGTISFASQEPWLFSASIYQNILFGNDYDENRYLKVIKACGLEADLAAWSHGDRTIVGEKGKILSGGQKARINLARCIYKKADIYLLDDPLSAVDSKVGKQLYKKCIKEFLQNKICILVTHQLQYLKDADDIVILHEGKIVGNGSYDYLQSSELYFATLLKKFNNEKEETVDETKNVRLEDINLGENKNKVCKILKEELEEGNVKAAVYGSYFKYGGNNFLIFLLVICFILCQGAENTNDYFISYWVDLEQEFSNMTHYENVTSYRTELMSIYSGITIMTVIIVLVKSIAVYAFFMRASINIHNSIFCKISYATMKFFNLNPTGRILNKFSEDLGDIDEYIPNLLADVAQISLKLLGVIILTSIVNVWLLLPSVILLVIFYFLRKVYMATSRSVKRIEGITRSPIFTHISATLQGILTVRAFSAENILIDEFDRYQDHHTSAWHLFISSSTAFVFWLDMICGIFVSAVILSLLIFNQDNYGGEIGLIVTQYLSLTGVLQWGMNQWSQLENHMTSVERVLEYKKVETEPSRTSHMWIPKNWPQYGKIVFKNVSMRYRLEEANVLNDISFTINSYEKVGVVGRTGAGKSSIVAALFQLYEISGSILIDDVDITKIPLQQLRSNISIIPQDPVLFSGTIRKNLDPFEQYDDTSLWNALELVELKTEITNNPSGLNSIITEGGTNYSIGQRQLVCLARAILRKNSILVMDEATANVDPHTDSLIQKTIRSHFINATVITIAHRLHTIMDSDKIVVVNEGKVVDFDHPYLLLKNTNSIFFEIVQTTGIKISEDLFNIAEESYQKSKKCG